MANIAIKSNSKDKWMQFRLKNQEEERKLDESDKILRLREKLLKTQKNFCKVPSYPSTRRPS